MKYLLSGMMAITLYTHALSLEVMLPSHEDLEYLRGSFSKFKITMLVQYSPEKIHKKSTALLAWVSFPVFCHSLCLSSTFSLASFLLKHLLQDEKARLKAQGHSEEKL